MNLILGISIPVVIVLIVIIGITVFVLGRQKNISNKEVLNSIIDSDIDINVNKVHKPKKGVKKVRKIKK